MEVKIPTCSTSLPELCEVPKMNVPLFHGVIACASHFSALREAHYSASTACPVPIAFSLLHVQVSSETSQPSREGEIRLSSGVRAVFVFQ